MSKTLKPTECVGGGDSTAVSAEDRLSPSKSGRDSSGDRDFIPQENSNNVKRMKVELSHKDKDTVQPESQSEVWIETSQGLGLDGSDDNYVIVKDAGTDEEKNSTAITDNERTPIIPSKEGIDSSPASKLGVEAKLYCLPVGTIPTNVQQLPPKIKFYRKPPAQNDQIKKASVVDDDAAARAAKLAKRRRDEAIFWGSGPNRCDPSKPCPCCD